MMRSVSLDFIVTVLVQEPVNNRKTLGTPVSATINAQKTPAPTVIAALTARAHRVHATCRVIRVDSRAPKERVRLLLPDTQSPRMPVQEWLIVDQAARAAFVAHLA
jgi:hypothetical protein